MVKASEKGRALAKSKNATLDHRAVHFVILFLNPKKREGIGMSIGLREKEQQVRICTVINGNGKGTLKESRTMEVEEQ